jgi:hypothetical protein
MTSPAEKGGFNMYGMARRALSQSAACMFRSWSLEASLEGERVPALHALDRIPTYVDDGSARASCHPREAGCDWQRGR